MAVALHGDDLGHLYDPCGGLADLDAGVVRILHERSFVDDPTRLLRAVRYETRLGFRLDPDSERLARAAVAAGALSTVSGARIRDELLDLLAETEAPSGVERLRELGIAAGLHPALDPDPELVASAALGALTIGADRTLTALAALCAGAPAELDRWLADLHLPAAERDAAVRAAYAGRLLAQELRARDHTPSELRELLRREPPEALALALAFQAPANDIVRWVTELSDVRLEIGGDDLVAAGVKPGPVIGQVLEETLKRKLDGLVRRARSRAGDGVGAGAVNAEDAHAAGHAPSADASEAAARADVLTLPGARVAFTTRLGGVSEGPYDSLNLGYLTDDQPERVLENRRRAAATLGLDAEQVAMAMQVHGADLLEHEAAPADHAFADPGGKELPRADGHLTTTPGVGLLVMVADCYPVALSDGYRVAMLHCGWRPLAAGILERALGALRRDAQRRGRSRASAAAATRSARRCWLRSRSLDGVVDGRMLDLRTVIAAKLAAAGVRRGRARGPLHELRARALLLPPP